MRKLLAASLSASVAVFAVSAAAAFAQVSQPPYGNVNGLLKPSTQDSQVAQASASFSASAAATGTWATSTSSGSGSASTTATTTVQAPPSSPNATFTAQENARLNGNAPYAPRAATAVTAPIKAASHVATSTKKTGSAVATTSRGIGSEVSSTARSLIITRNDVNLNASSSSVLMRPESVKTDADLSAFAEAIVASDPNVQQIDASDDHVSIAYTVPGRFLGIVPTRVQAQAIAQASGDTKISYPWYDFLVTVDDVGVKADLQSNVDSSAGGMLNASSTASSTAQTNAGGNMWASSTLNSSTTGATGAHLSDRTKALLLAAIHKALESWLAAQTNASATASSSASASSGY